jgi:hypothetical protein
MQISFLQPIRTRIGNYSQLLPKINGFSGKAMVRIIREYDKSGWEFCQPPERLARTGQEAAQGRSNQDEHPG